MTSQGSALEEDTVYHTQLNKKISFLLNLYWIGIRDKN